MLRTFTVTKPYLRVEIRTALHSTLGDFDSDESHLSSSMGFGAASLVLPSKYGLRVAHEDQAEPKFHTADWTF